MRLTIKNNQMFCSYSGASYEDLDGNPIERTPEEYPYSYDMHVTHRNGENEEITGSCYSDRLRQWDYALTEKIRKKHFPKAGDYYPRENPKDIEKFLQERLDNPKLKLIVVMEGCNFSTGYPVWYFGYNTGDKDE